MASLSLYWDAMHHAKNQKYKNPTEHWEQQSNQTIMTTETLELFLKRLPKEARKDFWVPDIPHNIIAACKLVDARCRVHL